MDVVVTVPKNFRYGGLKGLAAWISEGDAVGEPWSGAHWHFYLGGYPPDIKPGDRVYIVCEGKLRGYAPLVRLEQNMGPVNSARLQPTPEPCGYALVRYGGAIAVTIPEPIRGFQGFRYRWWNYKDEQPFPDWKTA